MPPGLGSYTLEVVKRKNPTSAHGLSRRNPQGTFSCGACVEGFGSLLPQVPNAEALAAHMGVPRETLREELGAYNDAVEGTTPDKWGKTVFPDGKVDPDRPMFAALVCPVVHYCMGGLAINDHAQVRNPSSNKTSALALFLAVIANGDLF